jgi:hypothetical protein
MYTLQHGVITWRAARCITLSVRLLTYRNYFIESPPYNNADTRSHSHVSRLVLTASRPYSSADDTRSHSHVSRLVLTASPPYSTADDTRSHSHISRLVLTASPPYSSADDTRSHSHESRLVLTASPPYSSAVIRDHIPTYRDLY